MTTNRKPTRRGFIRAISASSLAIAGLVRSGAVRADTSALPGVQISQDLRFRAGSNETAISELVVDLSELPDGPLEVSFSAVCMGRGRVRMLLSDASFVRKDGRKLRARKLRLLDGTEQILSQALGTGSDGEFLSTVKGQPFQNPNRDVRLLLLFQGEPMMDARMWTIDIRQAA